MSSPDTPRWVKISGIAALGMILLMIALMLADTTGDHGPFRHMTVSGAGQ